MKNIILLFILIFLFSFKKSFIPIYQTKYKNSTLFSDSFNGITTALLSYNEKLNYIEAELKFSKINLKNFKTSPRDHDVLINSLSSFKESNPNNFFKLLENYKKENRSICTPLISILYIVFFNYIDLNKKEYYCNLQRS